MRARLHNTLRGLGLILDPGAWIDPSRHVLICAYPRGRRALARLQRRGIRRLINLHRRPHTPEQLAHYALTERHVPVPDFGTPTVPQLATAVAAIATAVTAGERVAVHCGGGLGRSGTVAACYLIELGVEWPAAVASVRTARPGAIETPAQLATVAAYVGRGAAIAPGAV